MENEMENKERDFLLELAALIERYDAHFYYTTDDDGIHVALKGQADCAVSYFLDPKELRSATA